MRRQHPTILTNERGSGSSGSSVGSLVGGIIGGVVGAFTPIGPALGFALGSMVGGLAGRLFDTANAKDHVTQQESLTDLALQTSTFGKVIPQVWGTMRVAGNIFWATDKVPVDHREEGDAAGGKGGGPSTVVEYKTYTISMAIGLADTRVTGPIEEIRKIWRDTTLFWDKSVTPTLPHGWRFYPGTSAQPRDPVMVAALGATNVPAYRHTCYIRVKDEDLGRSGRTYNYTFEITQRTTSGIRNNLPHVVHRLVDATGVEQIDVSELPDVPVSMALVSIEAVRAPLEQLAQAYRFYGFESGFGLHFRPRASGPLVVTIPEELLGAGGEQATETGLMVDRVQDLELPTQLAITYVDAGQNYQSSVQQHEVMIPAGGIENPRSLNMTLVMTPAQAKQLAQELLSEAWIQRETYRATLPRQYAYLEPGDRIGILSRSLSYTMIIGETSYGPPGILEITGKVDDPWIVGAEGVPGGVIIFEPPPAVSVPLPTIPHFLNLPAIRSDDVTPRYHVAYEGVNDPWEGCILFVSHDGELTYQQVDVSHLEWIGGTVATPLGTVIASNVPCGNAYTLDLDNSFVVVMEHGTLGTVPDSVLTDRLANLVSLGAELLQFGVAHLIAPRTYRCSRLLRGRFGTEFTVETHAPNETLVLIDSGVHRLPMDLLDRDILLPFKAVTAPYGDLATTDVTLFAPHAENLVPWAPALVDAVRPANDWLITWYVRSRFSGDWFGVGGISWDIDANGFRVDIYDGPLFTTVVRSTIMDGGTPLDPNAQKQWTYDLTMQVEDFGAVQDVLYYRVFQLSLTSVGHAAYYSAEPTGTVALSCQPPVSPPPLAVELFDVQTLNPLLAGFAGAVYDGRYIYLVPNAAGDSFSLPIDEAYPCLMVRYDTLGAFDSAGSYTVYDLSTDVLPRRITYHNGVYDGSQYVYFAPHWDATAGQGSGLLLRYDTAQSFTSSAAWATFDIADIDGFGAGVEFSDARYEGHYVYFIAVGRDVTPVLVRYDTTLPFADLASYAYVYLETVLSGFAGVWSASVVEGLLYLTDETDWMRYALAADFEVTGSYETANLESLVYSGTGTSILTRGLTSDGTYLYLVPHFHENPGTWGVVRFDPSGSFTSAGSYAFFDLNAFMTAGGYDPSGIYHYYGAAYDGRYVWFAPSLGPDGTTSGGYAYVLQYDTTLPFTANASWTVLDLAAVNAEATLFAGALAIEGTTTWTYLVPGFNPFFVGPGTGPGGHIFVRIQKP